MQLCSLVSNLPPFYCLSVIRAVYLVCRHLREPMSMQMHCGFRPRDWILFVFAVHQSLNLVKATKDYIFECNVDL